MEPMANSERTIIAALEVAVKPDRVMSSREATMTSLAELSASALFPVAGADWEEKGAVWSKLTGEQAMSRISLVVAAGANGSDSCSDLSKSGTPVFELVVAKANLGKGASDCTSAGLLSLIESSQCG